MALINEQAAQQLREEFQKLVGPVRLLVFTQALADPAAEQAKRLIEEMADLEPKISAESFNFVLDKESVEAYRIARIPAIAVLGAEKDYGVRFYGLPTGYEFGVLVDAIFDVSRGESGLAPETREALATLAKPVHLQVFSTPT